MTLNIWSTENQFHVGCACCFKQSANLLYDLIAITMNENHTLKCECKMKNIEQSHLKCFTPYKMIKYYMVNPSKSLLKILNVSQGVPFSIFRASLGDGGRFSIRFTSHLIQHIAICFKITCISFICNIYFWIASLLFTLRIQGKIIPNACHLTVT